jgi:hypothetical protein
MEQTTLVDNVTDVETDTRQFIPNIETDTRQFDSIHLWHVLVCLVIGVLGIIGNCLTLIVLFRRKLWTSVNFLIGIMSISDLLVILLLSSVTVQSYVAQRVYIYEVTSYLRHTVMTSSIVSAIIIGCERSFAVRRPLKYRERWTKKLTIKLYLVMYIIFMSFVMTRPIVSNIISVEYFKEHLYTPYFIIVRGIPFVMILITNMFLINGLIRKSRRKQEMTSDSVERLRIKTETYVTRTVMIVIAVYLILLVPNRIMFGLRQVRVVADEGKLIYYCLTILEHLHFSVNVIIYTVTSKFYRRQYSKLLFSCIWCRRTCDEVNIH